MNWWTRFKKKRDIKRQLKGQFKAHLKQAEKHFITKLNSEGNLPEENAEELKMQNKLNAIKNIQEMMEQFEIEKHEIETPNKEKPSYIG